MELRMKKQLALIALPVILAACTSNGDASVVTKEDLQHHHWILAQVDGQDYVQPERGTPPSIEVGEEMTVNGFAGCNGYFGQGELKDGRFRVDGMGMTMMMCSDEMMNIEQVMSDTLSEWSDITLTDNTLTLKNNKHQVTFKLRDWVN
ncbi:META domain-containing protein [Vibrio sp. S9_S30]|uniref:META domain-containing protein n=1 Tax=Vibrio sp. S9_S30 TaxID=2720226 RepID=UPI001680C0F2|nr:META domain-containing protein [Vibrio sp. S9_S30]MBD1556438.1 META domain-containing protein [Vibrio sp. S9_S30]